MKAADSYSVTFEGAPDEIADELKAVSILASGGRELPTNAAVRRLASNDLEKLKSALQAAGYYAGKADFTFEISNEGVAAVVFEIEPGALFSINDYQVRYTDDYEGRPITLDEAGVKSEGAADGAALQSIQQQFRSALWNKGYPAARIISRRAVADLEGTTAVAVYAFESGPRATFGKISFTGAGATETDYLEKLKTWEQGEVFDRSKLVSFRDRLSATGLFGGIDVSPGAPASDGAAPVLVELQERKRRTIGAGLSYSTSEGPGARVFFEFRNLFHRGETARIEMQGSEVEQSLKFDVNKPLPDFPGAVFGSLAFSNETTDAFDARTVEIGAGLSRKWLDDRLETRGGLAFETSKVRTVEFMRDVEERTYFVSAPLSATWNTENSLLNPVKGVKASLAVTPYTGSDTFTITELNARSRVQFGKNDMFTAAFRGRLGSTFGSSLDALPRNKRFFAGGGASVRGYDFQAAGPLDIDGAPIGGRSVIEAAFEGRVKVTKKIQLAAFADAGSVSAKALPEFGGDYFVGVGGGVRYLTSVGPIRLDVATPLDKRPSDRAFQIYISLGQPF